MGTGRVEGKACIVKGAGSGILFSVSSSSPKISLPLLINILANYLDFHLLVSRKENIIRWWIAYTM